MRPDHRDGMVHICGNVRRTNRSQHAAPVSMRNIRAHRIDCADNFMTGHSGIGHYRKKTGNRDGIAVTDSACLDANSYLSGLRIRDFPHDGP